MFFLISVSKFRLCCFQTLTFEDVQAVRTYEKA